MTSVVDGFGPWDGRIALEGVPRGRSADTETRLHSRARLAATDGDGKSDRVLSREARRRDWYEGRIAEAADGPTAARIRWDWIRSDLKRLRGPAAAWQLVSDALAELHADLRQQFLGVPVEEEGVSDVGEC